MSETGSAASEAKTAKKGPKATHKHGSVKPLSVAAKPKPAKSVVKPEAPAAKDTASVKKTVRTTKAAPVKRTKPAAKKPAEVTNQVNRAEDMLDDVGGKIGGFLATASKSLQRVAAVAREEVEDLWAEVQSIRRGDTK